MSLDDSQNWVDLKSNIHIYHGDYPGSMLTLLIQNRRFISIRNIRHCSGHDFDVF